MRLIDITPKTKFYTIMDGKVVAVRVVELKIELRDQVLSGMIGRYIEDIDCKIHMELQTPHGRRLVKEWSNFGYNTAARNMLYKKPENAVNHVNAVDLTFSRDDLMEWCGTHSCQPTQKPIPHCATIRYFQYAVWVYIKENIAIGARLAPIKKIDLFNGIITAIWSGNEYTQWYNTKDECLAANTYEVEDFEDEDEDENTQDEPTDTANAVHIVFLGVVID